MELTISLLFFALASAVCIQLFVRAHNLNKESEALSDAHIIVSDIAEVYRAGELETLIPAILNDDGVYKEGTYTLYYDADCNRTDGFSSEGYTVDLIFADGNLDIRVGELYSLSVYRYMPGKTVASREGGLSA